MRGTPCNRPYLSGMDMHMALCYRAAWCRNHLRRSSVAGDFFCWMDTRRHSLTPLAINCAISLDRQSRVRQPSDTGCG